MLEQIQDIVHREIRRTLDEFAISAKCGKPLKIDVAVARQPVFDIKGNIWGYELLYHKTSGADDSDQTSDAVATARVIASGLAAVRRSLRQEQKLLIHFPAAMIETRAITLLPKKRCILEIMENTSPTPDVLTALKHIKAAGYALALDGYTGQETLAPFLSLADIVKFDVLRCDREAIVELVERVASLGHVCLAEKVEDETTRKFCRLLGFTLFQGFFFSKPELLPDTRYKSSLVERMRIFTVLNENPINIKLLSDTILHIPVLTAKLLAFVNSPHFAFEEEITNVPGALQLMGSDVFTQWLCVAVLSSLDRNPTSFELSFLASQRGKFLEQIGIALQNRGSLPTDVTIQELFLLGLFSLLEAIVKLPLATILQGVPLDPGIIDALTGTKSRYSPWFDLLTRYLHGEWEAALALGAEHGLEESDLSAAWAYALNWSAEFFPPESQDAPM